MLFVTHGQRGTALIETAIALPVALLSLFGLVWGMQLSTINERVQIAIRYTGMLATQSQAFHDYSLYTLYNALGTDPTVSTSPCSGITTDVLQGGSDIAAQTLTVPSFWQPGSIIVNGNSATACTTHVTTLSNSNLSRSYVFLETDASIDATVPVTFAAYVADANASQRFYRTPDLTSVVRCLPAQFADAIDVNERGTVNAYKTGSSQLQFDAGNSFAQEPAFIAYV